MSCEAIRSLIQEAHDGGPEAALPEFAREHIATCDACRELRDDLAALTQALRALPRPPFPPDALDAVWRQTVRARPRFVSTAGRLSRLAAAAALVAALSTATLYLVFAPSTPPRPTAVELARASAQAEMVLGYTARALAATRSAAADRVLASKVSPAVRGAAAPHPSRRP